MTKQTKTGLKELPEAFLNYNLMDLTKEEAESLKKLGLKWISEDENALIDYAINKMLSDIAMNLEKRNQFLEKIKKQEEKNKKGK